MQNLQKIKTTVMGVAVAHTTSAIESTTPLDIRGAGEAMIDLIIQTVATADSDGPIKLRQSDTSGGTYEDVSDSAFSVFPVDANDGTIWRILIPVAQLDLKRYLKVSYLQGDAGTATVTTIGHTIANDENPTGSPDNGATQTIVAGNAA